MLLFYILETRFNFNSISNVFSLTLDEFPTHIMRRAAFLTCPLVLEVQNRSQCQELLRSLLR